MLGRTREERAKYTAQAEKLVASLTLEEKVSLMSGSMSFEEVRGAIKKRTSEHYNQFPYPAGGIPQKHLAPVLFADGPRGVVCGNGKSTAFPVSMLRGATFDTKLEEKIGQAIGKEVLAYGGNLFAGVCINLPYNPGWGRSQETYSEDSFQLGEMGAALVRGVQNQGVMACVKHFAFNSMENARFTVDITMDKRTEREVFLPHFKKTIDAGAASVMSAYNTYQGTMCGHNSYLLNEVLKKEWQFDGFVMSDFVWGVKDTVAAANGGQNIEMPNTKFFGNNLVAAVKSGEVKESVIDDAALRIIRTILAFTDEAQEVNQSVIGCREHVQLALDAAREGITLIKNSKNSSQEGNVLPFHKNRIKRILVLGRLANDNNTGDRGTSQVYPKHVDTILEGLVDYSSQIEVIYYSGSSMEHSRKLAKDADAVVIVAGYDYQDEGEFVAQDKEDVFTDGIGGDRKTSLGLHADEQEMICQIGSVNENTVVVLIGGNMILLEEWADSAAAILMAYYPGMKGGQAVAEILFGDVNPSGKLPFVIPENEQDLAQVDWDATSQKYEYFHGYQKIDHENKQPRIPFGFGLSYTGFTVTNTKAWVEEDILYACADVKNIGAREGCEVLQLYIGYSNSKVERPVRALKGFTRVHLQPSEKRTVTLKCALSELAFYNEESNQFELEHMQYEIYMGSSSLDQDLCQTVLQIP